MGCGNSLTDHEKGMINAFEKEREITKKMNRSRCEVNNYTKNKNKIPQKIPGRPEKLSPMNKQAIIRDIRKSGKSVSQIQLPGDINVSRWIIWRTFKNSPNVEYSKGQKAPSWNEHHIKGKFSWAKMYVSFEEKWSDVVFTDEKKWNLDGPDGFHCYWHDLRKEKKIFKKRQSGSGSVMSWGAFCSNGIFKLVLVSGNMDSKQYTDMLIKHFLEDFFCIVGNRSIFQEDNAPIYVSRHSKVFFSDKNVMLMDWPELSPDLNSIKNLWGIVAR